MGVNFSTNIILQIITLYRVQMIIIIFTLNVLFRVMEYEYLSYRSIVIYGCTFSLPILRLFRLILIFMYDYYELCYIGGLTESVSRSLSIQHPPIFAALLSHGRTVDHIVVMIICSIRKINIQLHVLVSLNQCNYGHLSFYFTVDVVEYIFNII